MIDIHSHILGDVDDGAKSFEISLEMCRMAVDDGITHMVATPHANNRFEYDRPFLQSQLEELRTAVGRSPQLSLGCDFHLSYENLQDFLVHPQKYTIDGGKYLLVEMSNFSIPVQMDEWFTTFASLGVTPILTHPERNPILQDDLGRVLRWIELGCAVQVTASALTGFWGEHVWRSAQWLLKHNAVHFLATDAHDTKNRVPILSAARDEVAIVCNQDVAMALVEGNPRAVIEGKPLPYFPEPLTSK